MAWTRVVLEIGMGTDIRGSDHTKAAVRALRDALWHNSLGISEVVGVDVDSMQVRVAIAVPDPEKVDTGEVLKVLPHGSGTCEVVEGGLWVPHPSRDDGTIIAHAAAAVYLDLPEGAAS